jgi:hypothetical protein
MFALHALILLNQGTGSETSTWPIGYLDRYGELPVTSEMLTPPKLEVRSGSSQKLSKAAESTLKSCCDVKSWKRDIEAVQSGKASSEYLLAKLELLNKAGSLLSDDRVPVLCASYTLFVLEDLFRRKLLDKQRHRQLWTYSVTHAPMVDYYAAPKTKYEAIISACLCDAAQGSKTLNFFEVVSQAFPNTYFLDYGTFWARIASGDGVKGVQNLDKLLKQYQNQATPAYYKMRQLVQKGSPNAHQWAAKYITLETRPFYRQRVDEAKKLLKKSRD